MEGRTGLRSGGGVVVVVVSESPSESDVNLEWALARRPRKGAQSQLTEAPRPLPGATGDRPRR